MKNISVTRTADLRNFIFLPHPRHDGTILVGEIFDDERFQNGEVIRTTEIVGVLTKNGTFYSLLK